jgi:hypothetical protein
MRSSQTEDAWCQITDWTHEVWMFSKIWMGFKVQTTNTCESSMGETWQSHNQNHQVMGPGSPISQGFGPCRFHAAVQLDLPRAAGCEECHLISTYFDQVRRQHPALGLCLVPCCFAVRPIASTSVKQN